MNTDKAWEVYDYLVDFYFRKGKNEVPEREQEIVQPDGSTRDIAPIFRELLTLIPKEALDEMEKGLRLGKSRAISFATIAVLTEKIKRQIK